MTNEDKKMIPLSVVDALIQKRIEWGYNRHANHIHAYCHSNELELLQNIKKEAISIPVQSSKALEQPISIAELVEIRDTLDRASKDESWGTVTGAWQLTQNLIWKLKESIEGNKPLSSLTCPFCASGPQLWEPCKLQKHIQLHIKETAKPWELAKKIVDILIEKQSGNKTLEQRILQRIKEVESMTGGGEITRKSFLRELKDLLND